MLDGYLASRGLKASSAARYREHFRRDLSDWLDKPVAEVTPQMALARYEKLCRKSIGSANLTMAAFGAVCRRAIKILPDKVDGTPAMKRVPTESLTGAWKSLPRKTTLLEPDELPGWWNAVAGLESTPSRNALQALLLTGLRAQELLQLRWRDVDEDRRRLMIRDSKTGPFVKIIGPELASWLTRWRQRDPQALVFGSLRREMNQLVRLGGKRVTPHDLRRTFLTFGERVGAPITALKMLVNHSTKGDVTLGYIRPSDADLLHWASVIETSILSAAHAGSSKVIELRRGSWRE